MPPYAPERVNELCDLILERLASGVLLAKVLRQPDVDVPSSTFKMWRKARPDLDEAIEEARAAGFDVIASDSLDIVDGLLPVPGVPSEASRDKARADHRLKLLARYAPGIYGERVQHAAADGSKLEASPLVLEVMALLRPQTVLEAALTVVALPTHPEGAKGLPEPS
jgi:hypothetical protein